MNQIAETAYDLDPTQQAMIRAIGTRVSKMRDTGALSFPRKFVFQEMGYNAPANWKEKRS